MAVIATPAVRPPDESEPSLRRALAGAPTVKAACGAVVADLATDAGLMPSVYLVRGGRLRCQAVTRYWQVFDGMPPGAGVIGRTFSSGTNTVIANTRSSSDYLEAVPAVCAEVCVPVRVAGQVVGAINVESEQPLPVDDLVVALERSASRLGERIEELGGLERESRPARLARHAAALAALTDAPSLFERVLEAARDVAEMESAVMALHDDRGGYTTLAQGVHADALEALPTKVLDQLNAWVESMTSAYTIGEPTGHGFVGHEPLRAAGAEALVVLPIGGVGTHRGVLLLTDSAPIALDTEDVELLELLASQATACLATATALEEMGERAARDALTGLGHHATFHSALAEGCSGPTEPRLALLVVDVDGFKAVNDDFGHQAGDRLLTDVSQALDGALGGDDCLFRIGGDEFAALLRVGDRPEREAEATAERLRDAVAASGQPSVSIGVAIREPGEQPSSLFARADAALYRAKRGGRDATVLA